MHSHESDQLVERNAAVLAPGDAVSSKLTAVEPLGDGPWGDIANLGNLAGSEHILWRIHTLLSPESAVRGLQCSPLVFRNTGHRTPPTYGPSRRRRKNPYLFANLSFKLFADKQKLSFAVLLHRGL